MQTLLSLEPLGWTLRSSSEGFEIFPINNFFLYSGFLQLCYLPHPLSFVCVWPLSTLSLCVQILSVLQDSQQNVSSSRKPSWISQLDMIALRPQPFPFLTFLPVIVSSILVGLWLILLCEKISWSGNNEEGRKEERRGETLWARTSTSSGGNTAGSLASFLCLLLFVHVKCC